MFAPTTEEAAWKLIQPYCLWPMIIEKACICCRISQ